MNILVVGFGHFAGVVASCLSQQGHAVGQTDAPPHLLREGQRSAESEPGYIVPSGMAGANPMPDVVWIAYDCPLDLDGLPETEAIIGRITGSHDYWPIEISFLVSCQWPVGTTAKVEALCPGRRFFYVMENVRVGHAIRDFNQQYPIVGTRDSHGDNEPNWRELFILPPVFMTPESAEMTKHTTNVFMALQIAFINEIADLCEQVGADPDDVSKGLRSDWRVNPTAPLKPGGPFGGGSLLRDLKVLQTLANDLTIIPAIERANIYRQWMLEAKA